MTNVILDTNIYVRDFMLKSAGFKVLFDYLAITNCDLVLPMIVYEELAAVYARKLEEKTDQFYKAQRAVQQLLVEPLATNITVNISAEKDRFLDYLNSVPQFRRAQKLDYTDVSIQSIVNRAIARTPPCASGEQFRDAIVWLTVLKFALSDQTKSVIFISANTNDFAQDGNLHSHLLEEAAKLGVKVEYFIDLDHFKLGKAVKVDFVTDEWLNRQLTDQNISDRSVRYVNADHCKEAVRYLERCGLKPTGNTNALGASLIINEYFANELVDGSVLIDAKYTGNMEMEIELEVPADDDDPDRYLWSYAPKDAQYDTFEIGVEIHVEFTVTGGEVVNSDIIEHDIWEARRITESTPLNPYGYYR